MYDKGMSKYMWKCTCVSVCVNVSDCVYMNLSVRGSVCIDCTHKSV